ncbi:MAG: ATPase, T2SS/T4P/T4SS family, partial [Anaerolineales bacterium]|nr:ATPase, T2SS/T4P/T4SS family [Anaerolineales bacterium]
MELTELLRTMGEHKASDLHLKAGARPTLRIHGELQPVEGSAPLEPAQLESIFQQLTAPDQRETFRDQLELDFSYEGTEGVRYRINVSRQRGSISLALRRIPPTVPSLESLNLPPVCADLPLNRQGLILLTGPTGSGKSTTLAAMIDHINSTLRRHIVTIEDPIEILHRD